MKRLWYVPGVITAVLVSFSFSQGPAPRVSSPEKPADTLAPASPSQGSTATPTATTGKTWTPRHSFDYPSFPAGLPADLPPPRPLGKYVVLAWNDLGMHCYQARALTST